MALCVNHLFHETSLSISISILLWVQLIHQAWLLVLSCRANAVVVARQLWLDVVLTLTSQSAAGAVVDDASAVAVGAVVGERVSDGS